MMVRRRKKTRKTYTFISIHGMKYKEAKGNNRELRARHDTSKTKKHERKNDRQREHSTRQSEINKHPSPSSAPSNVQPVRGQSHVGLWLKMS